MNIQQWVIQDPEILGGTPVFAGTRVPVTVLFENLEDGVPLDEILENFPTLPKEAALALLEAVKQEVLASARQRAAS